MEICRCSVTTRNVGKRWPLLVRNVATLQRSIITLQYRILYYIATMLRVVTPSASSYYSRARVWRVRKACVFLRVSVKSRVGESLESPGNARVLGAL